MILVGIDPGLSGGIVFMSDTLFDPYEMPIIENGKDKEIDFDKFHNLIGIDCKMHIFLERAVPMAQGSKAAFNYGRGFAALEIAIKMSKHPVTYVEPAKWAKVMHDGISADLKPKAKSLIALKRLFPQYVNRIPHSPKSKKIHEGIMDATLIAGYGSRLLGI
jgi:hypothetical protein